MPSPPPRTPPPPPRPARRFGGLARVWGPALTLTLIGFVVAYLFVEPAPPRQITLATGSPEGAYHRHGERYRQILARDGITLRLRSTAGSAENLRLLTSPQPEVEAAFVQSGVAGGEPAEGIASLGSLYLEPLWLFMRGSPPARLTELRGKRIAIGPEGSGTRTVAERLLAETGLEGETQTLPLDAEAAAEALAAAEVDAAFIIGSTEIPAVRRLLATDGIQLMSLRQAPAIERRHPYLTVVTLHEGIVDLRKNIPATDVVLLAATAMLVARTDLHPALSDLLLKAAKEVHGPGALLERAGQFPSPFHVDIPLSAEAERFHRSGVPFLYRYLPFWAATLADRMKVLLIPLVTLLLPLFKLAPLLYQWHVRSKIYRWYADLRSVENGMGDEPENRLREKLAWIETEVTKVSVPLSYADDLYHLRLHIALVREKLGAGPGPGG